MPASQTPQRRNFTRVLFHHPAQLEDAGSQVTHTCAILDLSLRGAYVECAEALNLAPGSALLLSIPLAGADSPAIRIQGTLVHQDGVRVGLACAKIDLESLTHLRRIVELNTGDEALLHREFAALIDSGNA